VLGKTSTKILMHAIAVMRPRGGFFDAEIDGDVARSILSFLEYLPAPTRLTFPLGLRLVEYGPVLFREGFRRFTSMDDETATRYIHHWERAGGAPAMLYQGVRALVLVCFYQHPRILQAMEVDWQGRADERVAYRAAVLRARTKPAKAAASAPPLATTSRPQTATEQQTAQAEAGQPRAEATPAASGDWRRGWAGQPRAEAAQAQVQAAPAPQQAEAAAESAQPDTGAETDGEPR